MSREPGTTSGGEAEALLAGLDEQQRQAAQTLLGPVCLLAGAGTGKTRAITHRIAYGVASGVYPPGRVMALTFTARAAGELRTRLRGLGVSGVTARTFHAAAIAQLNHFWPTTVGGTMPRILEGKGRMLAHAADTIGLRVDTGTLRDAAAEIEWRKTARLSIQQYAQRDRELPPGLGLQRMLDLQQAYEDLKDERRRIDFEDVLLAAAGMLDSEPRVAQEVREQYRFFVVDEYQDVSPLQHDLLGLWLGDRDDVCVVGDVSQTIYTFAGARSDYLLQFAAEHENATVLRLEQNYRSTPAIVGLANRLMRGRPGALELAAVARDPEPLPEPRAFDTDSAEAEGVAAAISAQLTAGASPESIAVLYRVNGQSAALEAALTRAGVPFQLRSSTRFFDLQEVHQALMMLRAAAVTTAPESLVKTVGDVLRSLDWSHEPPEVQGAVRDRWESLDAIMRMARDAAPGTALKQFVDQLFDLRDGQHEPAQSAVTLATMHSAKGLEWDTVYLVGLSEGLVPIQFAQDAAALDEERRLFYVGITRARRRLVRSWSAGGRGGARRPSRFLAEAG